MPLNKIHKHFSKDCSALPLDTHPACLHDLLLTGTLSKPGLTDKFGNVHTATLLKSLISLSFSLPSHT